MFLLIHIHTKSQRPTMVLGSTTTVLVFCFFSSLVQVGERQFLGIPHELFVMPLVVTWGSVSVTIMLLTAVRVGSVCVRSAVDRRSSCGEIFPSPAFAQEAQDGNDHDQDQNKAGDRDPDRKIPLWEADRRWIVGFLQNK